MSRNSPPTPPAAAVPAPAGPAPVALPSSGGSYVFEDGKLRAIDADPVPEPAFEPTPETPTETGA